jgi:hypothetical protein
VIAIGVLVFAVSKPLPAPGYVMFPIFILLIVLCLLNLRTLIRLIRKTS